MVENHGRKSTNPRADAAIAIIDLLQRRKFERESESV